jgi:hypothetical protein
VLLCGVFILVRNLWWMATLPHVGWHTLPSAINLMIASNMVFFTIWILGTYWFRLNRSEFASAATVAAAVFVVFEAWPLALVELVVCFIVREDNGPVVET